MSTTKKKPEPVEEATGNPDKFAWSKGDIVWTKKPSSAQQLAGVQRAKEGPARKKK